MGTGRSRVSVCLLRPTGKVWEVSAVHGGHSSFSMSMGAVLAASGSPVIAHSSGANWRAAYGEVDAAVDCRRPSGRATATLPIIPVPAVHCRSFKLSVSRPPPPHRGLAGSARPGQRIISGDMTPDTYADSAPADAYPFAVI